MLCRIFGVARNQLHVLVLKIFVVVLHLCAPYLLNFSIDLEDVIRIYVYDWKLPEHLMCPSCLFFTS